VVYPVYSAVQRLNNWSQIIALNLMQRGLTLLLDVLLCSTACFSKFPNLFGPMSGATVPFISSHRQDSKSSNFAILLVFLTLKTCEKIYFSKHRRGLQFDNSEICVTKSIGLVYSWKACKKKIKCCHAVFALVSFCLRAISNCKTSRGLYLERSDLTDCFFAFPDWGTYVWRGLFSEFIGT